MQEARLQVQDGSWIHKSMQMESRLVEAMGAVEGPRVTGKSVLELDSGVNSRVCEFCDHHRSESMGRF